MVDVRLTDEQIGDIADRIGKQMAQHPPLCRAFDQEEIFFFKGLFTSAKRGKSVAFATVIGFMVLFILGLVGYGVIHRIGITLGK